MDSGTRQRSRALAGSAKLRLVGKGHGSAAITAAASCDAVWLTTVTRADVTDARAAVSVSNACGRGCRSAACASDTSCSPTRGNRVRRRRRAPARRKERSGKDQRTAQSRCESHLARHAFSHVVPEPLRHGLQGHTRRRGPPASGLPQLSPQFAARTSLPNLRSKLYSDLFAAMSQPAVTLPAVQLMVW